MAKRVQLPDGSIGEFPDNMSDSEIEGVLAKQYAPQPKKQLTVEPSKPMDPAEGMSPLEKLTVGAGGGLRRMYLGAKDLVGQGTPEEKQEMDDWSKSKKNLGGWGTAGEILSEGLVTAPIGGGLTAGAAKGGSALLGRFAPKVLEKTMEVLGKGGRVLNLGTAAKLGTEGAIGAGIAMPGQGETRAGNMAEGATLGVAIPAAAKVVSAPAHRLYQSMSTRAGPASRRAADALEKGMGAGDLEDVTRKVAGAQVSTAPAGLPKTTAALADSEKLGRFERGARARGVAEFPDAAAESGAWNQVVDATQDRTRLPTLEKRPNKIMDITKSMFREIPLDEGQRQRAFNDLEPFLRSDEVQARPELQRELTRAMSVLGDPERSVTAEILPQLHWSAKELGKGSDSAAAMANVLRGHADEVSDGLLTRANQAASKHHMKIGQSKAAKDVYETFMSPEGFSMSGRPRVGPEGDVPPLDAGKFYKTVGDQGANLAPDTREKLRATADELRRQEIYKAGDTGTPKTPLSREKEGVIGAVRATAGWKTLPIIKSLYGRADEATQKSMDEALADPRKFMAMMQAKALRKAPLKPWEQSIMSIMEAGAVTGGNAAAGG